MIALYSCQMQFGYKHFSRPWAFSALEPLTVISLNRKNMLGGRCCLLVNAGVGGEGREPPSQRQQRQTLGENTNTKWKGAHRTRGMLFNDGPNGPDGRGREGWGEMGGQDGLDGLEGHGWHYPHGPRGKSAILGIAG